MVELQISCPVKPVFSKYFKSLAELNSQFIYPIFGCISHMIISYESHMILRCLHVIRMDIYISKIR